MKLSLITITKNNLAGLKRTVKSILQQTISDVQYVIVDGESTDGTAEFLATLPDNFKVVVAKPMGVYNALNEGIKACDGDIIGMLHAGDTFNHKKILQKVTEKFNADRALGYLYGDIHYTNHKYNRRTRYYSGADCSLTTMLRGFAPPHPSLFMTSNVVQQVGPYREHFKIAGDFDVFLRLFSNSKIKGTYLPLDMVEMAPGGLSTSLKSRLYTNNVEKVQALRENGYKSLWLHVYARYYYIIKSTLCQTKLSLQQLSIF